jgi:hypothetical protein
LPLERVDNVQRGDSLALGVLGVGDRVADDTLEEGLEDTTGLFVDHGRDTLDTATAGKTTDGRLGDTLDVVTQDLAVTLGATLAESLSTLSACQVVSDWELSMETKDTHGQTWWRGCRVKLVKVDWRKWSCEEKRSGWRMTDEGRRKGRGGSGQGIFVWKGGEGGEITAITPAARISQSERRIRRVIWSAGERWLASLSITRRPPTSEIRSRKVIRGSLARWY